MNAILVVVAVAVVVCAVLRYILSGRMSPCADTASLEGKIAVVTGSTSGCGRVTALTLARLGATVVVVSPSAQRCEEAVAEIRAATGNHRSAEALPMDLGDLRDVERAAATLLARHPAIDVLVNNAAVMALGLATTKQGFDAVVGTNYLGHFHLTNLLLPALERACGRVVVYGSSAHWVPALFNEGLLFDAITHPRRMFWLDIYSQSKLACMLFGREFHRRMANRGVHTYIVDPGWVRTGITRTFPRIIHALWHLLPVGRPAVEGAQSAIYCASAPEKELVDGGYYYDCKIAPRAAVARDDALAEKLWRISETWVSPAATATAPEN